MLSMQQADDISVSIIEYAYQVRLNIKLSNELLNSHPSFLPIANFLINSENYGVLEISDICVGIVYSIILLQKLSTKNADKSGHEVFDRDDELLVVTAFMLAAKGPLGSSDDVYDDVSFLMTYGIGLKTDHPMAYQAKYREIYREHGYNVKEDSEGKELYRDLRKIARGDGTEDEKIQAAHAHLQANGYTESCGVYNSAVISCAFQEASLLKKFNAAEVTALNLLNFELPRSYHLAREVAATFFGALTVDIPPYYPLPPPTDEEKIRDKLLAARYEAIEIAQQDNTASKALLLTTAPTVKSPDTPAVSTGMKTLSGKILKK